MALDLSRQLAAHWPSGQTGHIPLLREAGVRLVLTPSPDAAFEKSAREAGIEVIDQSPTKETIPGAFDDGLWPGIRSQGRRGGGDETASASREPWVDANGWRYAVERALHPERVPVGVFAHREPERMVPFETLETALVEARINRGNFVLDVEPRYREALSKGDPKALAAWKALGRTAAWLDSNRALFEHPPVPTITALVASGFSFEIANLLFRRNAAPAVAAAASPPAPDPGRILALVAAALPSLPPAALDHARAGAVVVTDSKPDASWKIAKEEPDRIAYSMGSGTVVAYRKRIADPSEFALDVIDLITHRRRSCRLWNAMASIPIATTPKSGEMLLSVINYGSETTDEVQARVQGRYSRARLLRPESDPRDLKIFGRGTMTEVFLPGLSRLAVVHFSA
ncbi:MAG: hypothetical protein R2762_23505 [Bryobacteraceae bacterium]